MNTLNGVPLTQTVIGLPSGYTYLADTIRELHPVKHAFGAGVKAQMGIDY